MSDFDLAVITSEPSLARRADNQVQRVARIRHGGLQIGVYHRPARSVDLTRTDGVESAPATEPAETPTTTE